MGRGVLSGEGVKGSFAQGAFERRCHPTNNKNKIPFFSSLQVKYALSYLVIFAVVDRKSTRLNSSHS